MAATAILWLTQDLRLHDNPALHAAMRDGAVLPVYILDDEAAGAWTHGGAHRWWLHHSLAALAADLKARGAPLVLRRGDAVKQIVALAREAKAGSVHVGDQHEPWVRALLDRAGEALGEVALHRHRTVLLFDPEAIRTKAGKPYTVFTPYKRACLAAGIDDAVLSTPSRIDSATAPRSDDLDTWRLLPRHPDWAGGLRETWEPGEAGAAKRLRRLVRDVVTGYDRTRNLPGEAGTSSLSPHLHWGEISARQIWHAVREAHPRGAGPETFLSELIWREFCAQLLYHHPTLPETPLDERFKKMRWRNDRRALRAWQKGMTGVPIVDAGMRQLWHIGWQHNRVRMITASFLIKHLLIDWLDGERWFWDTLVDGDLGSNSANWQWVAGCGADASPFFRVFNPVLQGRKFDPDGAYVRAWVPELAKLPDRWLHAPFDAPAKVLEAAGVELGRSYPRPLVALDEGRARALDAFAAVSGKAARAA